METKKLIRKIEKLDGNDQYVFMCPGCKCGHRITVPDWHYDGNEAAPTISPSVLTWRGSDENHLRCHSFVKAGKIQFLSDCHHDLKNKTVPLEAF
jgi:hypothetical protein